MGSLPSFASLLADASFREASLSCLSEYSPPHAPPQAHSVPRPSCTSSGTYYTFTCLSVWLPLCIIFGPFNTLSPRHPEKNGALSGHSKIFVAYINKCKNNSAYSSFSTPAIPLICNKAALFINFQPCWLRPIRAPSCALSDSEDGENPLLWAVGAAGRIQV